MKKFTAILTTALVMALSTTTVFAAASPTADEAVKVVAGATSEAGTVTSTAVNPDVVSASEASAEAKKQLDNVSGGVESAEIAVFTDLKIEGVTPSPSNPVTISIPVADVTSGTGVIVLNFDGTNWVDCNGKAGDGVVTATFTHLSPVMIITYTPVASTTPETPGTVTPATGSSTPASPKTGVLPIAAIAAGICLAGAAVCGKKVKFN